VLNGNVIFVLTFKARIDDRQLIEVGTSLIFISFYDNSNLVGFLFSIYIFLRACCTVKQKQRPTIATTIITVTIM